MPRVVKHQQTKIEVGSQWKNRIGHVIRVDNIDVLDDVKPLIEFVCPVYGLTRMPINWFTFAYQPVEDDSLRVNQGVL